MKNITTVGVDIAKNVFQIHGVDAGGKTVFQKRVSRLQFPKVMAKWPTCLVGLEACGSAHYWARQLKALGHDVKLMSPQHVKPYIGQTKNDSRDAEGICEAVSRPKMRFVPAKSVEQQDMQALHRVKTRQTHARTALVNQIRGLLGEYGLILPKGITQVRNKLIPLLEQSSYALTAETRELMRALYDEFIFLDNKIKGLQAKLERVAELNEDCRRLQAIEGIGPISATALVAALGDVRVFANGRQMAAWLGLTPRQHSSGDKQRLLGITKRGDRYLRSLLIHGARAVVQVAARKHDAKSQWLNRLVARRGKNKAAVALANKTARTVWALLAKQETYRKPV